MSAEVEAGFFSFTEITDPDEHGSYNEWHQLDHLPQQYQIPGIVLGQRWVSSPACTAARVFDGDQLHAVDYVTLYLMSAPLAETLESFKALGVSLRAAERFHLQRRSRLSGPFGVCHTRAAKRVLVSGRVIPFRPNRGVYVIVEQLDGSARSDEQLLVHLCDQPGVAGAWTFRSLTGFERLGWRPGPRLVTVCYLDEPPIEVAPALGRLVRDGWNRREVPELAGPFETVYPWEWTWFGGGDRGG
jgi:hypothetical protein